MAVSSVIDDEINYEVSQKLIENKDELLEEVLLLLEELNCDQTLFELLKEQLDKTENL